MLGSTSRSDRARPSDTMKPSRASEIAGCSRPFHGIRPLSFHAMANPATVPGTPTERWLSW